MRGTSEALQVILVSLKCLTCTQPIRGVYIVAYLKKSLSSFCECLCIMSDAYFTSFSRQSRLQHRLRIEICSHPLPLLTATPHVRPRSSHIDILPCLGWCTIQCVSFYCLTLNPLEFLSIIQTPPIVLFYVKIQNFIFTQQHKGV